MLVLTIGTEDDIDQIPASLLECTPEKIQIRWENPRTRQDQLADSFPVAASDQHSILHLNLELQLWEDWLLPLQAVWDHRSHRTGQQVRALHCRGENKWPVDPIQRWLDLGRLVMTQIVDEHMIEKLFGNKSTSMCAYMLFYERSLAWLHLPILYEVASDDSIIYCGFKTQFYR